MPLSDISFEKVSIWPSGAISVHRFAIGASDPAGIPVCSEIAAVG